MLHAHSLGLVVTDTPCYRNVLNPRGAVQLLETHEYSINGQLIKQVDRFKDLGILVKKRSFLV